MNPHQDGLELSIGARLGLCRILRDCAEDLKAPMDALSHAADMNEGEGVAHHDQ